MNDLNIEARTALNLLYDVAIDSAVGDKQEERINAAYEEILLLISVNEEGN